MWHHNQMMMLVFVSLLFIVPVESRDVYNFCDTTHSDIIDMDDTSPPILIRSPNFLDGAYTSKQSCSLAIRAGDKPLVLVLKYILFDLEWNYACHYDSLCVYGVKFCGFWLTSRTQRYFVEKNSTFTMHFRADGTVEKAGFEIRVTAHMAVTQILQVMADGVGCGPNYVDTIPIVYGPRFHYQDKCALLHQTTTTTTTTTTALTTPESTTPEPTTPEPTTPEPTTPEPTTPEPENNVVTFCEVSPCTTININATSPPIIIRSPKFEHDDYDDNEHCSVVLKSGDDDLILSLYYSFFDIERDFFCSCDSLCVYGVQFCGWWLMRRTYKYIFKAGETFTLDFRTNGAIRRRGFEIHLSVEVAVSQVVHLISRGVGCDHGSIGTDDIVYHPSFNYFDKCAVLSQPICYPTTTSATTTEISLNYTLTEDDSPDSTDNVTAVVTTQDSNENASVSLPEVTFNVTDISSPPTEEEIVTTECQPDDNENAVTMETPEDSNENVTSTTSPASTRTENILDCRDDDVYTFCDESTCTIVYINASNPQVLIHSPNYGSGEYYHNQHCSIILHTGPEALILSLSYTFFDVEYDNKCSCDALCVNGVPFCGNWLTGHTFYYIVQAFSTFTLDYQTNNQIKNLGFEICVRSEIASSQTVDQISGGVGCSLDDISIFTVFYQISYVYTDACSALSHTICHPPHPTNATLPPVTTPDCDTNFTSTVDSVDDSTTRISNDSDSYSTADINFNNTGSITPRDNDQDSTPCDVDSVDTDTENTTTENPPVSTEIPTTTCGPEDTEDSTTVEIPDCSDDDAYTFCEESSCTVVYINASNPKVLIHSPNFGKGFYHHGQHCSMVLKTGNEPLILTFLYKSFDIEYDHDCCFDSLCVYGIKFCGDWMAGYSVKYVVHANSFFTLDFQTNGRIKRPGFEICVTAEIATSQTIDLIAGGIGSGWTNINVISVMYELSFNYTDKCSEWAQTTCYPKQLKTTTAVPTTESPIDCADNITTSRQDDDVTDSDNSQTTAGNVTRLIDDVTDTGIDVNITTPCNPPDDGGNVTSRDEQDESTTPSVTTDSSLDVTTCNDTDNELDATTATPGDSKDSTEKSSECVDGAQKVHTFCDALQSTLNINASSPPLVIRSPDFDEGFYPENLNCTLTLVSGPEPLILTLNYIFYDVQHHEICKHDWLCVNGVKFCGCWLFGEKFQYLFTQNSTFTLVFKTDDDQEKEGFEIQITHEVAQIGQTIVEAIEGIGSDGLYVVYSNVTYTPEYLYTDECLLFNDD